MGENKQLEDGQDIRYTWRIRNFSSLNESKIYSGIFEVSGCRWRLSAYPKGCNVKEQLSVYLEVADIDSLPDGWSRTAKFSINLINQTDSTKSITRKTDQQFKKEDPDWGFASFFHHSELHKQNGGYLVGGTCVIEAEVSVTDVFPVSTDESMNILSDAESIYTKAESLLKSISKEPTRSVPDPTSTVPSFKDHAVAKGRFNKLISFPLNDLVDSEHETAMIETLSILGDNLSSFSDDQAEQIKQLKADFPITKQKWRDSVRVKFNCERSLSIFEKTKNLLEVSVKNENGIKTELEELKNRENELNVELKKLQDDSRRLVMERLELSKQTQQIYAFAEEQAGKIKGTEEEMSAANKNLEDLKSNWESMKSLLV
ncbi:MATH domain and coiled-coil domain-containing protein At3g58270-like isoform X2 [Olea europaea var. sylvestris]|uniref:MATH domain and coiled-coil domain-containing protein At3g58270-like isoform X2 n=1 Tax=Olea europaea var. sylvestris TaxID=158386 RepID=UPI000C1CCDA2|nr:MATH domain and coiled-coil domain-containing protein At3g58270-like isoform X2 [Olea europaea var. sylvestris]